MRTHLRDPRVHELDPNAGSITTMTHHTLTVGGFRDKVDAVSRLVEANGRTIVFTRTRESATQLAEALTDRGVDGRRPAGQPVPAGPRAEPRSASPTGKAQVVVATDVAARGIHVDDVGLVVHFDAAGDAKSYLHRSGRTARAGSDGCVVTLTTPRGVAQVVRLQQNAGVEVLHHDFRTGSDADDRRGARRGRPSRTGPHRRLPAAPGPLRPGARRTAARADARPARRTPTGRQHRGKRPVR